ncbi:TadE/TadG family type IV pilus assembly protein [Paragemmobacter straminiformis]|uniref:Putative Flp pilus-assembly TadG-like N-terminal domain-containing protein n=1 Tax=Paragemmobacter straminiformis TaxID=2045119 RepID=A0A842ICD9_9RHOB|nr:pilus assembly protein TadG-related protein [Gemmobacter straminiformis]MBC2837490.1 hypothetical protein [Gemmobacter straminiformis]
MRNFLRSERGYVLILTLIFMPVFIGIGLLVIDIGRGNNAQQDHQAAADALALAGAKELDGQTDSIDRAKAAMALVSNTVSFLNVNPATSTQTLTYTVGSTAPFNVIFLRNIPDSDDTPIDLAYAQANVANDGTEAQYVYVFSRSSSLRSFFFNPLTRTTEDVPVGAVAVATLSRSTCDLAPIFMCNPFVGDGAQSSKEKLLSAFLSGSLHGRMVKLVASPAASKPGPGNIGYLRTSGKRGAAQLAAALAGEPYPECVNLSPTVTTQTGTVTSAGVGFNTRFDIHANNFGGIFGANGDFPPANNVRKGWIKNGASGCVTNPAAFDYLKAPVFSDNRDPATDLGGGYSDVMRQGPWNFSQSITVDVRTSPTKVDTITYPPYWQTMYPIATYPNIGFATPLSVANQNMLAAMTSRPGAEPSRYDVYRYEQTHDVNGNVVTNLADALVNERSPGGSPNPPGEKGLPQCYSGTAPTGGIDRRTMFVAVVDCATNDTRGSATVPVDLLAKIFLVNPLETSGNNPGSQSIDFEFVDVTEGSNGGLEEFLRQDAVLVR